MEINRDVFASLNMTTPFIKWVLTRLGEVKLHLDELFSPGPASET